MNRLVALLQRTHPVLVALGVSALAGLAGRLVPLAHGASLIAFIFLASTYWLCLETGEPGTFGLDLGGLLDRGPLEPPRIAREFVRALGWSLALSVLVLPPFAVGFVLWYEPRLGFSFARVWAELDTSTGGTLLDLVLGHLLVVALPEEAFFRGYLQSSLDRRWGTPHVFLGAPLGLGLLVTSLLFALGHLLSTPHPARLAVFFPSLLFGWLRSRSGGIGAPILFHATCNIVAALLALGYGFSVE